MIKIGNNNNGQRVLVNSIIAAIALFVNGFGVYLTIHASMGAGPWDVLNLGLSKTFGMLYGTASITVSFFILLIDVLLREPIGIAMIIDAIVVGKSVDFFNWYGLFFSVKTLIKKEFPALKNNKPLAMQVECTDLSVRY